MNDEDLQEAEAAVYMAMGFVEAAVAKVAVAESVTLTPINVTLRIQLDRLGEVTEALSVTHKRLLETDGCAPVYRCKYCGRQSPPTHFQPDGWERREVIGALDPPVWFCGACREVGSNA